MVDSQSKKRATRSMKPGSVREETLDPESWDGIRALGHRMLDDMMDHQKNIASLPFSFTTKEAVSDICVPLTEEGEGEEKVYEVFLKAHKALHLAQLRARASGERSSGRGHPMGCSPRCSREASTATWRPSPRQATCTSRLLTGSRRCWATLPRRVACS